MRTIVTILVLFLIQCTYLHAESNQVLDKISNSCIFGVKSVSLYLYNSNVTGEQVRENEFCNDIDPMQSFIFVVHGFTSYANSSHTRDLAMQLKRKHIVFALDWSQGACKDGIPILKYTAYPSAVINTREIGHLLANYTLTLIKQCKVPIEKITYIGHSLGAHVSGFAAKHMQSVNFTIRNIIGADPAWPLFKTNKCDEKLCKSDAKYVVALHTSDLGIQYEMGHLDLYFNGGHIQPKCGINIACSHTRAITYITDLFKNNCGFLGVSDSSSSYPNSNTTDCIVVNSNILDCNNSIEGKYYLFVDKDSHCTQETFNCKQ
ncbi:PREDICTED: phospholipase A1-like [Atta cephalotes]|uniref:phospholipase A1 n=1 Tax=Atta cephalotes TaxID=12957 RepID=A0A158NMX4_ATTCE|nr:PREDICTED: phospholipase A1-like [Atta cephalotes]